ncbi:MAG: hypothetical protein ACFFCQ_04930 [Promethearchaeota archaeon]
MTARTISLTEEEFNLLLNAKLPHETYGETITRLCRAFTTTNLKKWLESIDDWQDISEEEFYEFINSIKKFR